ncbi:MULTISPECIES: aldehyde dehydrogenase family protein [unclassified Pseudomonas]|uniref:aldehyde dehydrogenase family protein n=1 Tax=unclassified Pseudomonas TaxID=196821 RepID=UPI000C2FA581|nr:MULTISPECIES: aldehyde dehydrogenase family protein [unclassified Pseudomonas]MCU1739327.1 aldehyde dehydrogenase family protein [Pseudomonas sp. 20S_6.2_Bac1]
MNDKMTQVEPAVSKMAFDAARGAFKTYFHLTTEERLAELSKLKETILIGRSVIIERVMKDVGKCRTDALIAEILGTVDWINWLEKNAVRLLRPEKVKTPITLLGKQSLLLHEPLGVVLIICPWNYPFHNAITGIAAAIVTGNAVVYKPSEHAPCVGLIEQVLACSPVLQSLVQVVYGDGQLGSALIDEQPAKIFFTGSGPTGGKIMAQASKELIPVELELGGKDPMIVFSDAPIARSVAGALWGAFTNAGQSCSAVERLLVQDSIHEHFIAELVKEAGKIVVRPDDSGDADIGRMTVGFQRDKVIEHVQQALASGARLRFGQVPSPDSLIVQPIILDRVTPEMLVWKEETFGPVLPVMAFSSEAQAIHEANATSYGLCASVFTADAERGLRVAQALDVGGVSINNVNMSEGNPGLPFGGAKKSGFGKLRGPEGLLGFTRSKAVLIDTAKPKIEANWYPYTQEKFRRFERFIKALYFPSRLRLLAIAWHGFRLESFSQKPRK